MGDSALRRGGCHSVFIVQHAFNSLAEVDYVEIEKQSKRFVRKAQVGEQLSFVYRKQRFNALQFNDHRVFDQKIKSEARVQMQAVIHNGKSDLPMNRKACCLQLVH
jgi:hypothetical protein